MTDTKDLDPDCELLTSGLLKVFETAAYAATDDSTRCHVLLCAERLGIAGLLFSRMLDIVATRSVPPELEMRDLVGTFLRQLVLLTYQHVPDQRREFLDRWLNTKVLAQQDIVTIAWVMGLAAEQQELLAASSRLLVAKWYRRLPDITSVRTLAWMPRYLELWGDVDQATLAAQKVLNMRLRNGSWEAGASVTAGAAYALSRARCARGEVLRSTQHYILGRLQRGSSVVDLTYPLNSLKFLSEVGWLSRSVVSQSTKRFEASIFLSHASTDKEAARKLALDLQANGVRVWFDEAEIRPGDSILAQLEAGLSGANCLVLLASETSLRSRWVLEELRSAMHDGITSGRTRVVAIRMDSTALPPFLRDKKYLSFENYDRCLDELLALFQLPGVQAG